MDRLHLYFDWLNVMTYDFFNALTSTTGHHAGLYASQFAAPNDRNTDASVKQARAPFLRNAASRTFITYDDTQSIAAKARYVKDHRLGGMMFWELSQDSHGELLDTIVGSLNRR